MDAGCCAEKVDYNILAGTSYTLLALHQVKIGVQLSSKENLGAVQQGTDE